MFKDIFRILIPPGVFEFLRLLAKRGRSDDLYGTFQCMNPDPVIFKIPGIVEFLQFLSFFFRRILIRFPLLRPPEEHDILVKNRGKGKTWGR